MKKDQKALLLEQLKKTPIVQIACEKLGISRMTYYRWRKSDTEFAKASDEALSEGSLLINDMAESQLISAIRDKNMTAVIYWLKNHHTTYTDRLEISGHLKHSSEKLTPEQEALIKQALRLVSSSPKNKHEKTIKKTS
ncbi:MAG: hypothetical protein UW14_C0003G0018 [Candidatus Yanofskybacteria bacterium GW2011_GWA2_44_10]|nr:MAG: hypothetical protein UW14_C0003G0018 [Candidatus Yanofskybacteria bacterium GW2011_GWA2_44_10]